MVAASIPVVGALLLVLFFNPLPVLLAAMPAVFLLASVFWIDRLEPEPSASRVHALLWGGTVAVLIALVFNGVVAAAFGMTAATVIGAPVIEEAGKALGLWWAVRRGELDSPTNGVVYAVLVAAGFAAVENVMYFATAAEQSALVEVFVVRGILTPFAHPLFTIWIGLVLGRWVERTGTTPYQHGRCPHHPTAKGTVLGRWAGLPAAMGLHAAWNASVSIANGTLSVVVIALFVVLFFATATWLVVARRRALDNFLASVPSTAVAAGLDPHWTFVFSSWPSTLRARKPLDRQRRAAFDRVHAAVSRLVAHRHAGSRDLVREQHLAAELNAAVVAFGPWGRAQLNAPFAVDHPRLPAHPGTHRPVQAPVSSTAANAVWAPPSGAPTFPPHPPRR